MLAIISVYGIVGTTLFMILTITEMIIMKVIYIHKFSKVAVMNEYFISTILVAFNIVISIFVISLRVILKEYVNTPTLYRYFDQQIEKRTDIQQNAIRYVIIHKLEIPALWVFLSADAQLLGTSLAGARMPSSISLDLLLKLNILCSALPCSAPCLCTL